MHNLSRCISYWKWWYSKGLLNHQQVGCKVHGVYGSALAPPWFQPNSPFNHTRNSSSQKTTPGIQAYLPLQWLMLPVTGMAEVGELVNVVFGWRMKLELDDGKVRTFFWYVYNLYIYMECRHESELWFVKMSRVDMNLNCMLLECQDGSKWFLLYLFQFTPFLHDPWVCSWAIPTKNQT